jgi:enterochelin esterase family protein
VPEVTGDAVAFAIADRRYARVALRHELRRPRLVPFSRNAGGWRLRLERPPVDRLEYLLELEHPGGDVECVPDPANMARAPGPFGEKSVVEFPGYAPPAWLAGEDSPAGALAEVTLASRRLRASVGALLWCAADTDPTAPLPLVLVHDGPEYAAYSQLLRLFDYLVAHDEAPPFRAALVPPPPDRNETYSASTRYARALVDEWLPALRASAPFLSRPVGVGASLGALALLHAHWTSPGPFGALLLQSGSFFRRRFDAHESRLPRFARIVRFVSRVAGGRDAPARIPLVLTCGSGEENLDNNRFLAATLAARGWDARLHEHPDAHNWISWRDSLHPYLAELVARAA